MGGIGCVFQKCPRGLLRVLKAACCLSTLPPQFILTSVHMLSFLEEEAVKQKMLAFEELRKRLEAQHMHQLSLLIAEQEREQERLQKVRSL